MHGHRVLRRVVAAMACSLCAAATVVYQGPLTGGAEVPPVSTPAIGYVSVSNAGANLLQVDVTFSGLSASATAAHIHCCAAPGTNAGVAVPMPAFPTATSGHYIHDFLLDDASTYSSAFITASGGTAAGAQAALLNALLSDDAYFNIHNSVFPGGEVRAILTQTIFRNGFD
ncbi:MAG: CHRD domain-containing protein [Dokdonella sp.]